MNQAEVLIIGAGMGGLTAALALQQAGIPVRVYEQAPVLSEVGAGIMITPNASAALAAVGAYERVKALSLFPSCQRFRHYQTGEVMTRMPYGAALEATYGYPFITIHRADLQLALKDAVLANDPDAIVTNHLLTGVRQENGRVYAQFANGNEVRGDVLVAADGIRSAARKAVVGAEPPRFTGNVAYRGMVAMQKLPESFHTDDTFLWVGPQRNVVHYAVKQGAVMNYVCIVERDEWAAEGWNVPADVNEVLSAYDGWHEDFRTLVSSVDPGGLVKWGLFARDPLPTWVYGRVALLGDAAHAMLPFLAQGAAMAMEDAVVLARALAAASTIDEGLTAYERARYARATEVQARSLAMGQVYHRSLSAEELAGERAANNHFLFTYDAATALLHAAEGTPS